MYTKGIITLMSILTLSACSNTDDEITIIEFDDTENTEVSERIETDVEDSESVSPDDVVQENGDLPETEFHRSTEFGSETPISYPDDILDHGESYKQHTFYMTDDYFHFDVGEIEVKLLNNLIGSEAKAEIEPEIYDLLIEAAPVGTQVMVSEVEVLTTDTVNPEDRVFPTLRAAITDYAGIEVAQPIPGEVLTSAPITEDGIPLGETEVVHVYSYVPKGMLEGSTVSIYNTNSEMEAGVYKVLPG